MGPLLIAFEPIILVFHFIIAILLITFILLQSGKGTDIGAAFGAGGSGSLFGARGASTFLTKTTTVLAIIFLITSLSLATSSKFLSTGGGPSSVIDEHLKQSKDQTVVPNEGSVLDEPQEDNQQEEDSQ